MIFLKAILKFIVLTMVDLNNWLLTKLWFHKKVNMTFTIVFILMIES